MLLKPQVFTLLTAATSLVVDAIRYECRNQPDFNLTVGFPGYFHNIDDLQNHAFKLQEWAVTDKQLREALHTLILLTEDDGLDRICFFYLDDKNQALDFQFVAYAGEDTLLAVKSEVWF